MPDVCYLCGLEVSDADRSADHVPPKQFYAATLRKVINLDQLVTLVTHKGCNNSFSADEEYFTWSLSPLATGRTAGDALHADRLDRLAGGRAVSLYHAVKQEFDSSPGGLILPGGLVVKRFDAERVTRIAWKLTRGLYFIEHHEALPDTTPRFFELIEPELARSKAGQNAVWESVKQQSPKGVNPGVFDYKYLVGEADGKPLHCWGMLLWDRLMLFAAHHDPQDDPAGDASAAPSVAS